MEGWVSGCTDGWVVEGDECLDDTSVDGQVDRGVDGWGVEGQMDRCREDRSHERRMGGWGEGEQ